MRCAKCGAKNTDGVEECLRCGSSLSSSAGEPERQHLIPRALVALVVGLLVFSISCNVAYHQFLDSGVRYPQEFTLKEIGTLGAAVAAYREKEHALPKALTELPRGLPVRVDENGTPLDSWRRPVRYWTDGTHYRITSYGLDGKPGGVGLDYDLSTNDLGKHQALQGTLALPRQARPTFRQFMTDRGIGSGSGRMMFLTSVLTGVLALVLGFRATGGTAPFRWGVWARVAKLLIITAGALLVGLMIAGLHIPSGH